ncbi:rRNA-processing protein EBP2 [Plasmodium brasilianum]|uniref:rRNA-processing protein EBP2 n=1 Tax=Plasmodium brasilianum TaxID=5824 RepID=A0ACB9Y8N2_PLABR|nr:rRNA-processing protein EBP2 [Plasmodium brasilianum]
MIRDDICWAYIRCFNYEVNKEKNSNGALVLTARWRKKKKKKSSNINSINSNKSNNNINSINSNKSNNNINSNSNSNSNNINSYEGFRRSYRK